MSDGMRLEEFLARLGRHAGSEEPGTLAANHEVLRLVKPDEDLIERFVKEARQVGMYPHLVPADRLEEELARLLAQLSCKTAVLSMAEGSLVETIRKAMQAVSCEEIDWRHGTGIDPQYDVDLGITDVIHGVAETGSLILSSAAGRSRGAHLAPPIHVAILEVDQVLPDLIDFFGKQDAVAQPTAQVIVTGPSKTADIEGVLVTGVHGPKEVHIFLLQRPDSPSS
ncbi:MAG: LutC/YkgG family protein [Planctomycetota bacterium]|jgi:L-lactate dehydrogenase complex protein LldG